jgi:hypothetical protein
VVVPVAQVVQVVLAAWVFLVMQDQQMRVVLEVPVLHIQVNRVEVQVVT